MEKKRIDRSRCQDCPYSHNDFMQKILEVGDAKIKELNRTITRRIKDQANGRSGSHIDGVSTVATADALASLWIFGETEGQAIENAVAMGMKLLTEQFESPIQFILDWLELNRNRFSADIYGQSYRLISAGPYGFISAGKFYIYPSILNEALKKHNFSSRKTLRYLSEQGIVTKDVYGKNSIVKHVGNRYERFVEFDVETAKRKSSWKMPPSK